MEAWEKMNICLLDILDLKEIEIFWMNIRVSHFTLFFELSLVLLTTHAHGL